MHAGGTGGIRRYDHDRSALFQDQQRNCAGNRDREPCFLLNCAFCLRNRVGQTGRTGGKTLCQTAVQRQDTRKRHFAAFVYIAQKTGKIHEKRKNAMINF